MNIKQTGMAGLLAASVLIAGQAAAATLQVQGNFVDYRSIGVGTPLTGVSGSDPSTWPDGAVTFTLTGTVTVEGGIVTGATLAAGPLVQLFSANSGANQTLGTFNGLEYEYTGGTVLKQRLGSGANVTGSAEILQGTLVPAYTTTLTALQNETSTRFNDWNGIPQSYTVSDLFGGSNIFFFPLAPQNGVTWSVGGTAPGDSITAQLFRSEPFAPATFNSAFAGRLDLQVVPVPAAVWLLGSAVGLLGSVRRRAAA